MKIGTAWHNIYWHYMWDYVQKTYGKFGDDPRLYVVFHGKLHSKCNTVGYYSKNMRTQNIIDFGHTNEGFDKAHGKRAFLAVPVAYMVEGKLL